MEKKRVQSCIYHIKKKASDLFGRKMNHYKGLNGKLFWKEIGNAQGRRLDSCNRIKEDMCDFGKAKRGNCFGRANKLGKSNGKNEMA